MIKKHFCHFSRELSSCVPWFLGKVLEYNAKKRKNWPWNSKYKIQKKKIQKKRKKILTEIGKRWVCTANVRIVGEREREGLENVEFRKRTVFGEQILVEKLECLYMLSCQEWMIVEYLQTERFLHRSTYFRIGDIPRKYLEKCCHYGNVPESILVWRNFGITK